MFQRKIGRSLLPELVALAVAVATLTHSAIAQENADSEEKQERSKTDADNSRQPKPQHALNAHTDAVTSVAYSPDGKTLATASHDKTVKLWDVTTGKELLTLRGHTDAVNSVAFSPDGKTLASAGWDKALLWDVTGGKQVRAIAGQGGRCIVAFAPDGKTLAAADRGRVRLWDVASGKETHSFPGHGCGVDSVVFAADGRTLASAGSNPGGWRVLVWDVASDKQTRELPGMAVAFSTDGKTLATAGAGETARLWDVVTGKEIRSFAKEHGLVRALSFAPDGKTLAAASGDKQNTVWLWDVASGKEIRSFAGHLVAFAPDGKTLASVDGSVISIWDASGLSFPRPGRIVTAREVSAFWDDLVNGDISRSFAAAGALIEAPGQSVPFMRERIKPIAGPDPKLLARLIDDLDSNEFAVRQKASLELGQLGELAEPALRGALDSNPPLEVHQRIEALVNAQRDKPPPWEGERLRLWRAIQVLEGIGSPEAQAVLKTLAEGAAGSRLTQEAKASLVRLANRSAVSP